MSDHISGEGVQRRATSSICSKDLFTGLNSRSVTHISCRLVAQPRQKVFDTEDGGDGACVKILARSQSLHMEPSVTMFCNITQRDLLNNYTDKTIYMRLKADDQTTGVWCVQLLLSWNSLSGIFSPFQLLCSLLYFSLILFFFYICAAYGSSHLNLNFTGCFFYLQELRFVFTPVPLFVVCEQDNTQATELLTT